jgi:hypothetical protein
LASLSIINPAAISLAIGIADNHMPHAKIFTKQATFTLERLHAELAGKVLENKKEAQRLHKAMVHVEEVLKLLQPGYNVRPISIRRRKPNPWFKRGTLFRAALDILRAAEKPIASREIVTRLLAAKGIANPSRHDRAALEGGIYASLRNHKRGLVERVNEGLPALWKIRR